MDKICWTDREHGRQFWVWNPQTEEWVKGQFVLWADLKAKPRRVNHLCGVLTKV